MPKLTETTNDKVRRPHKAKPAAMPTNGTGGIDSPLHIVAAHEPLRNEPWIADIRPGTANSDVNAIPLMRPPVAPVVQPAPLKVALVGTAPSSRLLAPFADPSWKIWACSPGNMNGLPRYDAWFEIHGNLLWPENKHYGEPYVEWLKKLTVPIYMHEKWPTPEGGYVNLKDIVPNAIVYPKDDMVKKFGGDFFTSSFAWMMALAIDMGASEIALYGIDMASRDEYILQRPGFYFFRYIAQSRGIKISAPNESDIMMSPGLYGYSDVTPFARKLHARRKEIRDRIAQMENEKARLMENSVYLKGADEDIDYVLSIWSGVQDNSPE